MNKKDIKYYSVIVAILIITIVIEIMKPKPIDWAFYLEAKKKSPYGTYVLFKTIKDIFPEKSIITNKKTTYELLKTIDGTSKNYIYIADNFDADKLETEAILNLTEKGNSVFISAHNFSKIFKDTLQIAVKYSSFFDTTGNYNFYNRKLKRNKPYFYGKASSNYFFSGFKAEETEVLAFSRNKKPIFIKHFNGNGVLYLNTTPEIFTNYGMVTEKNYDFAYKSLSYLPVKNIVWDEYYKPFRKQNKGLLDLIFNNLSLKIAYIILMVLTLLFVFFTAKRRQRIIPVTKPVNNKTLEFIETIGRVYFNSKNHKDIALKKYKYFKHFLLKKYFINLSDNEDIDQALISEKTGVEKELVKKVLLTASKINKLEKISQEQLNTFNNFIEDFYENCK